MDHLPHISKPQVTLPKVPFLVRENCLYDGIGLTDFAERLQFNFQNKGADDVETSAFFQAWLYFGTLTEFLGVHGVGLQYGDFVVSTNDGQILTTRHLWDYLAAWVAKASQDSVFVLENSVEIHWHSNQEAQLERAKVAAGKLHQVLQTAFTCVNQLLPYRFSILASVWDSTLVLFSTLKNALIHAYRSSDILDTLPNGFSSPIDMPSRLLTELFDKGSWCPKERHALATIFDLDLPVLLCCATLDRRQENISHFACTTRFCKAYQVDEMAYSIKHVRGDCSCSFLNAGNVYQNPIFQPKMPRFARSLDQIPALTFKNGTLSVVPIVPFKAEANMLVGTYTGVRVGYVAFSHVWAQGRGNPYSNALPQCQLEQLQSLANRLYPTAVEPIPFWIDTICIPLEPTARKLGIESMERVYKSAPTIMVLDDALMQIRSKVLTSEEIALQIACCAWSRRLWTLQEGLYQKRVFYRFADAVQTFPFLNDTVRRRHDFPNRARTVPQGHFLHSLLDQAPNCSTPKDVLRRNAHKALSFWPRISSFFKQIDILHSWQGVNNDNTLGEILRSMMTRTTSKIEDESLVFVSATSRLAGSARDLLEVEASERYRSFFKPQHGYSNVPGHLIFLDQRRYEELGSRWIPRSVLSQEMVSETIPYMPRDGEHGIAWATGGLRVRYPGVIIETPCADRHFPSRFRISLGEVGYICDVHEAGFGHPITNITLQHAAIILQRDFNTQLRESTAVLVEIVAWDKFKTACKQTSQTEYVLSKSIRVGKYGKELHYNIYARHEGLVRINPIMNTNESSLSLLETRKVALEESSFLTPRYHETLPRWLVL